MRSMIVASFLLCGACSAVLDTGEFRGLDGGNPPDVTCVAPILASTPLVRPADETFGNMELVLNKAACSSTCFVVTSVREGFDGESTRVCVEPGQDRAPFWHHVPIFTDDVPTNFTVEGLTVMVLGWGRAPEFAQAPSGDTFAYDGIASLDIDNFGTVVFATTDSLADEDTDTATDTASDVYRWNLDGSFTLISLSGEEGREPRISDDGNLVGYFDDSSETVRYAYATSGTFRRGAFLTAGSVYQTGVGGLDLGRNSTDGHLIALGAGQLFIGARPSAQLAGADQDVMLEAQPVTSPASSECEANGGNPGSISLSSGPESTYVSYTNPCLFYFCDGDCVSPFEPYDMVSRVHDGLNQGGTFPPEPIIENGFHLAGQDGVLAGFLAAGFVVGPIGEIGGDVVSVVAEQELLIDGDDDLGYFIFRDATEGSYSIARRNPDNTMEVRRLTLDEMDMAAAAPPTDSALSPVAISPDGRWAAYALGDETRARFARIRVR